jgi:probable phosphoglycerate mutase
MVEVVIVRHAETTWSASGQHTGRTDIPLTDAGRAAAHELAERLRRWSFTAVLSSPLSRARETAQLAGYEPRPTADLEEWDYGDYEGLTTPEIRARRPGWDLWRDGCPGGEDAAAVAARADRVLAALPADGAIALFAHGHVLRVLTARWLGLEADCGALFALPAGAIGVLGHERERRVMSGWGL